MKKFIGVHNALCLTRESVAAATRELRLAQRDEFGVRCDNIYYNAPDCKVFCLCEGSDEEAIRRYHAVKGVGVDEVTEVQGMI